MVSIRVLFQKAKDLEKGSFFGEMESTTRVSGKMAKNMVVATGNQAKEIAIWVSGKMDKLMDMEFTCRNLDKDMKGNFLSF